MVHTFQAGPGEQGRGSVAAAVLRILVAASILWAIATALGAEFSWRVAGLRLSSREPLRPLVLAAVLAAVHLATAGGGPLARWLQLPGAVIRRWPRASAGALALATIGVGLAWHTHVASASDQYGYVSQAHLWLQGDLRIDQRWAAQFAWPDVEWSFSPLGYRPGPHPFTIVPTYPPGLPLLMAGAALLGGPDAMFFVVPLLGGLAVLLTFRLGRSMLDVPAAWTAAALLATSPAFLHSLIMPMSDVAATALWTLALVAALGGRPYSLVGAGIAAGAALAVRPNLLLLAGAFATAIVCARASGGVRSVLRRVARFAAGMAPGVLLVAAVNWGLYGSPLRSGYGDVGDFFAAGRALTNIGRYTRWLWDSNTAVLLLVPFVLASRRAVDAAAPASGRGRDVSPAVVCYGLVATVALSYLFYLSFETWPFVRFLLPAFPPLIVLGIAGFSRVVCRLRSDWRTVFVPLIAIAAVTSQARLAIDNEVFAERARQQRFRAIGLDVEKLTPPNAMLLAMLHSGSVRFYGHRPTLRYDRLPQGQLGSVLAALEAHGYVPYLVVDESERRDFRSRFGSEPGGRLDQPPMATVPGGAALYSLTSSARAPN